MYTTDRSVSGVEELLDWGMGLDIDHPYFIDVAIPMEALDHVNFDIRVSLVDQMNNLGLCQVNDPQIRNVNGMVMLVCRRKLEFRRRSFKVA